MDETEEKSKRLAKLIGFTMAKPSIVFPAVGLRAYMESVFSMGAPPALYHACEWVAHDMVETLLKKGSFDDDAKLGLLANIFSSKGWGILEFLKVDMKRMECNVRVKNCFECEEKTSSPIKDCYMIRGLLTGALSAVFNRRIIANGVKCRFRGDDHCEVVALPL